MRRNKLVLTPPNFYYHTSQDSMNANLLLHCAGLFTSNFGIDNTSDNPLPNQGGLAYAH